MVLQNSQRAEHFSVHDNAGVSQRLVFWANVSLYFCRLHLRALQQTIFLQRDA